MQAVNDFISVEKNYRGTKFILREVDVATYDDCLKKATVKKADPISGEDVDDVDENLFLRLLLSESLQEPKLSDFRTLGTRLMRQLERDVRALHFEAEVETQIEAKEKKAKKDEIPDDEPGNVAA